MHAEIEAEPTDQPTAASKRRRWPYALVLLLLMVLVAAAGLSASSRPADPRDNLWYVDNAGMLADGVGRVESMTWSDPIWLGGGTRLEIVIVPDGTDRFAEAQLRELTGNLQSLGLRTQCARGTRCTTRVDDSDPNRVVVHTDFQAPRSA